jgi:tetratricopeptide (TPR) repeat protein
VSDSLSGSIALILAYARSGALDRAWAMFEELGLEARRDNPAVLTLHARLLKDRARRGGGEEQRQGYLAAAKAYREAAEISPATYPLINAATLLRLAGMREEAAALAADMLSLMERRPDIAEAETPYYREATRAEALLLQDQYPEAQKSLERAQSLAPRAWEDHATTLRQFALILSDAGQPTEWLDRFRPPRAAHFAGSIRLPADDAVLASAIDRWIVEERIGFSFGALAAGADILIAEAMVRAGAELHILLPGSRAAFVEVSVRPFGDRWEKSFDALMDVAESVREIDAGAEVVHPAAITLADSVAMGMAVIQARRFETEAVQLIVTPRGRIGVHTDQARKAWVATGRRQHHLTVDWLGVAGDPKTETSDHRVIALLAIGCDVNSPIARKSSDDVLIGCLPALGGVLASHRPMVNLGWHDRTLLLAYASAADAARAARAIIAVVGPLPMWRVAGHIGILRPIEDPLSGRLLLFGEAIGTTLQILRMTPEATILISDSFAASMNAAESPGDAEPIGELDVESAANPIGLWSLRF